MKHWSWAIALTAIASCHPEVKTWRVTPQAYCPSTKTIRVEWKGKHGSMRLEETEPGQQPKLLSTKSSGTMDLPPKAMDLRFIVEKGSKAPAIVTTTVGSAAAIKELGAKGYDCNQSGWMETKPFDYGGSNPDVFADNLRLGAISNACPANAAATHSCKRSVKLEHLGQTWTLAPGATLDVSGANVEVGGSWTLSQSLLDGEVCRTPSATPSVAFSLEIGATCTEKP